MLLEGDGPTRSRALLAFALHDEDWRWVQDLSLGLAGDADPAIRATAALAVRELRRDVDDYLAVSVLSFNVVTLSLNLAGLAYSLWLGLYGIVLSPSPP